MLVYSSCSNNANNQVTISNQSNQHLSTSIDQNSLCVQKSNCQNNGSTDQNHLTNTQSALCANTSDCNNSGNNDRTICANGSNCANTGQGTTVIATHADCSSGPDGTTKICLSGGKSLVLGGSGGVVNSGTSNSGSNNNANSINPQPSDPTATKPMSSGGAISSNNSPGISSSTQSLIGSQMFGQNQHIATSDNMQAGQNALNEQQNLNSKPAGGTAPTTQAIFGNN